MGNHPRKADGRRVFSAEFKRTTVSARLLYQGYMVAMCNLHVIFGSDDGPQGDWPLLAIPSLDRFLAVVS